MVKMLRKSWQRQESGLPKLNKAAPSWPSSIHVDNSIFIDLQIFCFYLFTLFNLCNICILNLILQKKTCPQQLTWKRTAKRKLTTTPTPGRSLTRWIVVAFLYVLCLVHNDCTDLFFCLSCHTIILSLRRIINSHSIVYHTMCCWTFAIWNTNSIPFPCYLHTTAQTEYDVDARARRCDVLQNHL